MSEENEVPDIPEEDEEEHYEMSAAEATSMDGSDSTAKPPVFNRKRVFKVVCITLAVFICGGFIFNTLKPNKKKSSGEDEYAASSRANSSFLNSLRDSAVRDSMRNREEAPEKTEEPPAPEEPLLPPVSFDRRDQGYPVVNTPPPQQQYQQPPPPSGGGGQPNNSPYNSSLVPQVQGSLFNRSAAAAPQTAQSTPANSQYDDYLRDLSARSASYGNQGANNTQNTNQAFYDASGTGGVANSGRYLGENSIWTGTIIPGILETAINTDLPGNVLARVTQNIYDSQTGRQLLIPQGTLLIARYNSSISYAQSRVQIVWDTMIRPDGFQIDLDGANGVDRAGMSGQAAIYNENWFEYVKAAGIITMFSIANAKLTETVNKYTDKDSETAANVAQANANFFNQLGGELVSRAMNIQPTLTVDNGTLINIMLSKTLYLPPVPRYAPTQRYILER